MGRKHIVISSFFVAFLALSVLCYGSYRHAQQVEIQKQEEEKNLAQAGKVQEQKTTSKTKYQVEKYNQDSEEFVKEERAIPAQYVGVTRTRLEQILRDEITATDQEEEEKGLVHIALISFSEEKIVIRKTYREQRKEGFVLKIVNGEVAVYYGDGKELYEMTGIREEDLLKEDREALQKGYTIQDEKELYSILENFSS